MRRRAAADFEFGDVESIIEITPDRGVEDIPATLMDSLNATITSHLMQRVLPALAWSITTLELTPDEVERASDMRTRLHIAGYSCKLTVNVILRVKLEDDYIEALLWQSLGSRFATVVSLNLGQLAVGAALKKFPSYEEALMQKLLEGDMPGLVLREPSEDDHPTGGQYL